MLEDLVTVFGNEFIDIVQDKLHETTLGGLLFRSYYLLYHLKEEKCTVDY